MKLTEVNGNSMKPTLLHGQIVLIRETKHVKKGDLIAFYLQGKLMVKRLIGLPNQNIALKDGILYINGNIIQESYLSILRSMTSQEWQLAEDQYIVLGDNSAESNDSRNFGPISLENILGKVVLKIWPIGLIS